MRKIVVVLGFAALAMAAAGAFEISAIQAFADALSADTAQVNPPLMYAGIRG
jgi:hypothetical protein